MRKKTIGILFILSIIMLIIGIGLFIAGVSGSASVTDPYTNTTHLTSVAHLPLFIAGIILYTLAFVPFLIAWIGALVNLARLQRWTWFVLMFVFNGFCLIAYLFAGPDVTRTSRNTP